MKRSLRDDWLEQENGPNMKKIPDLQLRIIDVEEL